MKYFINSKGKKYFLHKKGILFYFNNKEEGHIEIPEIFNVKENPRTNIPCLEFKKGRLK